MMTLAPWATMAVVTLSLGWLALMIRVFTSPPDATRSFSRAEGALLALTLALALLWTALAPPWNLGRTQSSGSGVAGSGTCATIREGMTAARVRELMRTPPRVVSEEDVRGPRAEALVYDDARCIVHMFKGRVVEIEEER